MIKQDILSKIRYINKLQDLLKFQPTHHQVAILHTDKPPYEELGYKDSRYYQRLDYPLHLKGTEYGAIYIVFDNTLTYPDILRLTLELPKLGKWHLGNNVFLHSFP